MKRTKHKGFWDRFAGIYDRFMRKDRATYEEMYRLMGQELRTDMEALELATGTGLIALRVAERVKRLEATDFSEKMIAKAKSKPCPKNVRFSVQDACQLPYADDRFDAVIIANALHIMPRPEAALESIRRVLKPKGILLAPTFVHGENDGRGGLKMRLMRLAGFQTFHWWTKKAYVEFLNANGFQVERSVVLPGGFPLAYVSARIRK